MGESEALMIASLCFAPVSREEWDEVKSEQSWSSFLKALRGLGVDEGTLAVLGDRGIIPSYEEKDRFARRHFTGGLPVSAVPVESLYLPPEPGAAGPAYLRDTALYMRDTLMAMGAVVPEEFSACPDHLSLELQLASSLFAAGMTGEVRVFLAERLAWLPAYEAKLQSVSDEAAFYVALVASLSSLSASCRGE